MTSARTAAGLDLLTFPNYPDNPWQRIVYADAIGHGARRVELQTLDDLAAAARMSWRDGRRPLLHMNWTTPVTQAAPDHATSMDQALHARELIEDFRGAGGSFVWSIHNTLPHETRFVIPELILCRYLAGASSTVVIMNPATTASVDPLYPLDTSRMQQIDHPSYVGEFPQTTSRAAAREILGLADDDVVNVFVGAIRPYKGLERLLEAFDRVAAEDPRQRLLIAGRPGGSYTPEDLARIFAPRPYLITHLDHVPDARLQHWLMASDLMLLPYTAGLNVSVLLLGASFGLPVAVTRLPELAPLESEPWLAWLPVDDAGLPDAIRDAQQRLLSVEGVREAALAYARERSPQRISARYREVFDAAAQNPS